MRQPYLGKETVIEDAHSLKMIISVLKGNFERVTVEQVLQFFDLGVSASEPIHLLRHGASVNLAGVRRVLTLFAIH